jgi:hypothetical protein
MSDKSLKDKKIELKSKKTGKKQGDYVLVASRVVYFNEMYPNGCITTYLKRSEDKIVLMEAVVTPDVDKPERRFNGHAQEMWGDGYINRTSALENCETSAVGRALAMMGIGVLDSIASVDEVVKAQNRESFFKSKKPEKKEAPPQKEPKHIELHSGISPEDMKKITRAFEEFGVDLSSLEKYIGVESADWTTKEQKIFQWLYKQLVKMDPGLRLEYLNGIEPGGLSGVVP